MTSRPKQLYEFGPFVLDPAERTLLRDGSPVPLQPKVFDTLLVLVRNCGRLVEKGEFMRAVWPEDEFVEEQNLNKNISKLRRALGIDEGGAEYIETVPKSGYRFAADVRAVNGGGDAELVFETRTRASVVAEEETDKEPSVGAYGGARVEEAVIAKPTAAEATSHARPRRESGRRLKGWAAPAAAVFIIVLAAVVYLSYPAGGGEAVDSVAVLPFVNASGDPEADYLSDGIGDSIINSLSRLPNLRVISLNSVLRYKGRQVDARAVGRELNVRAVLMGRLVQRGDGLAVSTELVDVRDNRRLWGAQYDRKLSDIAAVQGEIAREISEGLRLRLTPREEKLFAKRDTENTEAYRFYLKGRYFWNKRTADGLSKAIDQFQQAIVSDPNYALSYVGLADCYLMMNEYSDVPESEALMKARAAVERALQIDGSLAEAHTSMGQVHVASWQWEDAEREFKLAIELNPNYPTAHQWYANYLRTTRRFDEAMRAIKRAQELDPLSLSIANNIAHTYLLQNNVNSAVEQCERNLELDPAFTYTHAILGHAYLRQRRYQEATAELQKAVELSGRASVFLSSLGYCYAVTGRRAEALTILNELEERYARREANVNAVAKVYLGLGEKDRAFAWLERGFQQHSGGLPSITNALGFEDLRGEPRYSELLRRMNLEP